MTRPNSRSEEGASTFEGLERLAPDAPTCIDGVCTLPELPAAES